MKTKFLLTLVIALGFGIASASAQVRKHAANQHVRIHRGIKSGELTKNEAHNLRGNEKDLNQDIKLAKSDGKISRNERKIIRKEERKDSRKIYRKKHNDRERH